MRDFYDICVLVEMYGGEINVKNFKLAYEATCRKRDTLHLLGNEEEIIDIIEHDSKLSKQWASYQKKFSYASDISFMRTIKGVRILSAYLKETEV